MLLTTNVMFLSEIVPIYTFITMIQVYCPYINEMLLNVLLVCSIPFYSISLEQNQLW